jgi:hypothetical protein
MTVNLKRGFLEGAAVAAICAGLVVVLSWRLSAENPFTSLGFSSIGLVTCSSGLLGFLVGAFRHPSVHSKK